MIGLRREEVRINAEDDSGTAEFESVKERLEELERRSAKTHGDGNEGIPAVFT